MILLDTHIWLWLIDASPRLRPGQIELIDQSKTGGLGVSIISCWEVAKLVENGKMSFRQPVLEWIETALAQPYIRLLPLTPEITVDATQLPSGFHRDPADQLIVATSRVLGIPLLTADGKILDYPHVSLLK